MKNSLRELNPDSLFHLVVRRWDLLLLIPLLTLLAAGLAWQISPDRYQSTARLLIQDQQTINPFQKDMLEEWSAKQRMPLVESILQSHSTSERVLRKLGRLDDAATPEEVNEAVERFQESFQVVGLGGELVLLKVDGETPAEAYEATTALIHVFTEQILRPQRETVRASAAFFEDQLERFRGESSNIEPTVAQLPEAEETRMGGQLSVRRALAQAEVRLAAAEQQVEASEAKLKQRTAAGSLGSSRLRKELAEARGELIEIKYRYGKNHPELAAAKQRVRALQRAVNGQRKDSEETSGETADAQLDDSRADPKSDIERGRQASGSADGAQGVVGGRGAPPSALVDRRAVDVCRGQSGLDRRGAGDAHALAHSAALDRASRRAVRGPGSRAARGGALFCIR